MARGWESKSVEEQIEAAAQSTPQSKARLSRTEMAKLHRMENLTLSRKQVLQQLQASHDSRHRAILERALADLDIQLATLND